MWLGESSVVSPHEVLAGSWRPCPWAAILLFACRPGFIVHLWTAPGPELFRVYTYLASPIFLMILAWAQYGLLPAVLPMLRSALAGEKSQFTALRAGRVMSSGALPGGSVTCRGMQLCPPAFTTVQNGSEFHFTNIGSLHERVSGRGMRALSVAHRNCARLSLGGGLLRTLIDSELVSGAPARSGSSRRWPAGSGRLPGSRASGRWAARRRRVPDSGFYAFRTDRARTSPWCVDRVPAAAGCPRIPAAAWTR